MKPNCALYTLKIPTLYVFFYADWANSLEGTPTGSVSVLLSKQNLKTFLF